VKTLRSSRDFGRVFAEGHRRRLKGLVVVDSPNGLEGARIGLVVGRSNGSAVVRNRIKRRLRHAAAKVRFPLGRDYVLVASREVRTMSFHSLVENLQEAVEEKE